MLLLICQLFQHESCFTRSSGWLSFECSKCIFHDFKTGETNSQAVSGAEKGWRAMPCTELNIKNVTSKEKYERYPWIYGDKEKNYFLLLALPSHGRLVKNKQNDSC